MLISVTDNPCLAQYSDGKYYRAKLVRFISVEPIMILVHHVDFGSDDTLPTSKYDLHTLQEFTSICIQSLNVQDLSRTVESYSQVGMS